MVISEPPHGEILSQYQYTCTLYESLNLPSFSDSPIPKHASTHMYWQNGLIKKHRQIPPLFTFSFRLGIHGEGLVRPPRQGTIYRCDVFLCNWRVGGLLTSWKCETWHIPGTEITCWRVRDGGEMEQERKSDGHDIRWNVWKDRESVRETEPGL